MEYIETKNKNLIKNFREFVRSILFATESRLFPDFSQTFPRPFLCKMFAHIIGISMKPIGVFLLTIIILSSLNWIGIQFLATHCATWSLFGPIKNLLSLGSPVCMFVNHLQVALADYYITLWAAAASSTVTWIAVRLSITKPSKNAENSEQ